MYSLEVPLLSDPGVGAHTRGGGPGRPENQKRRPRPHQPAMVAANEAASSTAIIASWCDSFFACRISCNLHIKRHHNRLSQGHFMPDERNGFLQVSSTAAKKKGLHQSKSYSRVLISCTLLRDHYLSGCLFSTVNA